MALAKVILVEAAPRRIADGAAETVRLAGGGFDKPYVYDGQHWRAGIARLPTTIAALNFEGGEIGSGAVPRAAIIEWQPFRAADLAAMAAYFWPDAAITVRIGAEGSSPPVVLSGNVLDASVEAGILKLSLSDPAAELKKPLLTARYAGTGGVEGPAEWDGKIKRRLWGRLWNLAGEPIDKANNVYAFSDPTRPLQAIDAVYDRGAATASLNVLAWQGSVAATFAALQAASAPAGGGVVAPSIACLKWWTTPSGDLTADIRGEVGTGYVETAAQIAERIVQARGGLAMAAGTVANAAAARPAAVGWIAKDDSTTAAAMIEQLLADSSLMWLMDNSGQIVIRSWAWGSPSASAISEQVARRQVLRPLATRKLGWRRNETQMARGDIAAAVLAGDIRYSSGETLDSLKPAQAGADATGSNIAAGIAGQAATATNSDYGAVTGTKPPSDADKTGTNIAAGIAGQAATATNSDYGAVTGAKPPSDADKTGTNIAAGIAGQAATATNSDYGAVTGAKPPSDADKTGANIAAGIAGQAATATNSDYGAVTGAKPPSDADKTGTNIAAGIAGQAATATNSDYSAVTGSKPPSNATNGAPSGTPVGSITANDVASTISPGGGVATNKVSTPAMVLNAVNMPYASTLGWSVNLPRYYETSIFPSPLTPTASADDTMIRVTVLLSLACDNDIQGYYRVYHTPPGGFETLIYGKFLQIYSDAFAPSAQTLAFVHRITSPAAGTHSFRVAFYRTSDASIFYADAGTDQEALVIRR